MSAEGRIGHKDLSLVIGTPQEVGTGSNCTLAKSTHPRPMRLLFVLISTLERDSGERKTIQDSAG